MAIDPPQDQIDNLANLYHTGQIKKTINTCKKLLITHKKSLILLDILGASLCTIGEFKKSLKIYNKAIRFDSNNSELFYNRGVIFQKIGQLENAIENYRKAIQLNPNYSEAYNNIGAASQELGESNNAIENYRKAIQLNPNYSEAYSNLGNSLREAGELNNAIENYRKAIQLNPNYSEAYNNIGSSLREAGELNNAIENYRKAIQLNPNYSEAYSNLGAVFQELGQLDEAIRNYRKVIQLNPSYNSYSNLLMTLSYDASQTPSKDNVENQEFSKFIVSNRTTRFSRYNNLLNPKKLRIGFVSGDFYNHPVGHFLESVISNIDANRIDLIAYSTRKITDDLSERIKPFFSKWNSIYGESDKISARKIHNDEVHILIDLSGHTAHNRLSIFGCRPAPIQVSWLGYWATTGLNEIDYFLGDPHVTPAEYDHHFVEKVWRLPETRLCFTPPNANIEIKELPALKNEYITFGCFNNLSKINNDVLELWSKVLKSIPNSHLILKTKQFRDKTVCENIIHRFLDQGIDNNRITLEGPEERNKYLLAYNRIDITLDPFPFTGGTTSAESLWMGVPILTLSGDSLVSRQGVGILMNTGLQNWIANNEKEYVHKASYLSSNLDELSKLRAGLREQVLASPLFDAQRFAKNFEESLWGMWEKYLQK